MQKKLIWMLFLDITIFCSNVTQQLTRTEARVALYAAQKMCRTGEVDEMTVFYESLEKNVQGFNSMPMRYFMLKVTYAPVLAKIYKVDVHEVTFLWAMCRRVDLLNYFNCLAKQTNFGKAAFKKFRIIHKL